MLRGVRGQQSLHHALLQESVALSSDAEWALHFKDGWGFIVALGRRPIWATSLFKRSCWQTEAGRIFVRWGDLGPDGSPVVRVCWLEELLSEYAPRYISWKFTDISASITGLKVLHLRSPVDGATLFWGLADLQRQAQFRTKWISDTRWIAKSVSKWAAFLGKLGVPSSHIMRPSHCKGGGKSTTIVVETWFFSTAAFLIIMCRLAADTQDASDRAKAVELLRGWLRVCLSDATFCVSLTQLGRPGEILAQGAHCELKGGEFFSDAKVFGGAWKGRDLCAVLLGLYRSRSACSAVFSQLVCAIAKVADDDFPQKGWPSDPMLVDAPTSLKRKRADPTLRSALCKEEGGRMRNSFRAAWSARRFGKLSVYHQGWVDKVCCKRYLMACARSCARGASFAISTDSSKVVYGKSWLKTALYNVETREAMWCAPQVFVVGYAWGGGGGGIGWGKNAERCHNLASRFAVASKRFCLCPEANRGFVNSRGY